MKTSISNLIKTSVCIAALFIYTNTTSAQTTTKSKQNKKSVTVLNVDTKGFDLDAVQMGNLVRLELDKVDTFEVMDRYDVAYMIDKNKLNINNCYGKLCLVEIGNIVKTDKMFTGSVELYGDNIVVTLRIVDVATSTTEKTQISEFLNLPKELQTMIGITIKNMFHMKNDEETVTRLTKKFNYDNATNNPDKTRLALDGPRMGCIMFTGDGAKVIKASRKNGGYDGFPIMSQFGYQFEKQYLNEGNFQALFEFIPMVTGLDQGYFIPSITVMNGLRSNLSGWEFAFGPTFSFNRVAEGYDDNGTWKLKYEGIDSLGTKPTRLRSDRRGDLRLSTGFVFAFGKTFQSGKLNIPVNAFVIPNKEGVRFGVSFGFNGKNTKRSM